YRERYSPKDDNTLRLFFGVKDKDGNYRQNIEKIDIDRFRSLVKLLKGEEAIVPHEKNYKLLAWLINFDGEDTGKSGVTIDKGLVVNSLIDSTSQPLKNRIGVRKEWISKPRIKNIIISFVGIAAVSTGVYWRSVSSDQKCMYWTGNAYQTISCNEKVGDTAIIALDTFKLAHLKRITRQDTLTKWSVGRIFYSKVNSDSIDVFTSAGSHPVRNGRKLMPLTNYMYVKYISRK
ncbi:hypothetical protein, partial [Pedobacter sp.]|uniref:hypothetical protein n=1 Tax=Pedobacter sp. TaxID=1411316 RepID=UPI002D126027